MKQKNENGKWVIGLGVAGIVLLALTITFFAMNMNKAKVIKDEKTTALAWQEKALTADAKNASLEMAVSSANSSIKSLESKFAEADASAKKWQNQYYAGLNSWKQEKNTLIKGYESDIASISGQFMAMKIKNEQLGTSLQKSEDCYAELQDSEKKLQKALDFYKIEYGNALKLLSSNEQTWSTIANGRKSKWALKRFDFEQEVLQQEGAAGVEVSRVSLTPKGKKTFLN